MHRMRPTAASVLDRQNLRASSLHERQWFVGNEGMAVDQPFILPAGAPASLEPEFLSSLRRLGIHERKVPEFVANLAAILHVLADLDFHERHAKTCRVEPQVVILFAS